MSIQDEIENFLSKVQQIIFVEVELPNKNDFGTPLIFFLFSKDAFDEYLKSNLLIGLAEYFRNTQSKFLILLDKERKTVNVSIVNKHTADSLNVPNVSIHPSFYNFMRLTGENDKIQLLIGCHYNNQMLLPPPARDTSVILDGYSLM